MIFDVESFDDIIRLPIRPPAQLYLKSTIHNITGKLIAENVNTHNVADLTAPEIIPNPNNLRVARLGDYGYKVDDPNLRVLNNKGYCNLMFYTGYFYWQDTKRLFYNLQYPYDNSLKVSVKIGPIFVGSFRFDWIRYEIDTDAILSTQSVTLTNTDDYEDLVFDFEPTDADTAYQLKATVLGVQPAISINFGELEVVGNSKYIITNSNLINYTSDEQADLYSQSRSSFEHTVKFLDVDHLYDPQNPQGRFSELVIGASCYIYRGYNINGMFVDAYSTDWNNTRETYYLKDLPVWENEAVTLNLADGHTINSNLTTQSLALTAFGATETRTFAPGIIGIFGRQVLTQMDYYIRFTVDSYNYAYPIPMTIEDAGKKYINTMGYLSGDNLIEDVYTLSQNALGCWNYGKNVSDISVADVKDYVIDNSVIYDEGISLTKQPMLKTLTVKRYDNTLSAAPLTYTITLQASDFERWSDSDLRPYRAELNTDNTLTNILSYTLTKTGGGVYGTLPYYDRDLISGLCKWRIYVTTADPNDGAGTYTLNLYPVETTIEDISEVVNNEGENLTIDNPFITSTELVTLCANAAKKIAAWRDVYEIDVMENFKLRVGDIVKLNTIYEQNIPVIITGLQFNIPGPKGHITCRRID